jgi:hypothetical protein
VIPLLEKDGEAVYVRESCESPSIEVDSVRLGDSVDVTIRVSDPPDVRPIMVSSVLISVSVRLGPVYVVEYNVDRRPSEGVPEPAEKNSLSESEVPDPDPDKRSFVLSLGERIRRTAHEATTNP